MTQDPQVRQEAHGVLSGLFSRIGGQSGVRDAGGGAGPGLGGALGQLEEFVSMPADLARLFLEYAVELTDATLTTLEDAGFVIVKAMTPL